VCNGKVAIANNGWGARARHAGGAKKDCAMLRRSQALLYIKFYVCLSRTSLRTGLGLKINLTAIQKATIFGTVRLIAHYLALQMAMNLAVTQPLNIKINSH